MTFSHPRQQAVQDQEKAWLLHDYMLENIPDIKADGFDFILKYGKEIGLDFTKLSQDMFSQKVRDLLRADLEEGKKFKLQGTPTFFINGISITGAMPMGEFTSLIDTMLKK
ncbi:MAG: thioredoxin domain-containing protein [Desulfobacteraceae bacterium]|nr:thioredoxin domain-containing protein [Desulfobacteraceae bacterium]